ncbi:hypothetical protein AWB75_00268 [Caballeronia catudaia]|uniref:Uncharacterized protein n=1 Tax=Caballeronia catudaia TaxID=1777136 RepID=A0A157Z6P2_9BURK|nr:hypothetical protein [Caballeronia catudaia]SAK40999.1 hypothetical protein AWB75_00268 [Caballeronia catudaia]
MSENINQTESSWDITPEELREIQERAAKEREIELEVRRRMGQKVDTDNAAFIDALMSFPAVDVEDWIFDRSLERELIAKGELDVSR